MTSAENYHLQINQAASALRELFEAQLRDNTKWRSHTDKLNARIRDLETQMEGPPEGLKVWGDRTGYSKRIVELETRVAEMESTERRLREFMRLKDIAKMKVERTRDIYERQRDRAEERIAALHDKAAENAELKAQNERQAASFQELEARVARLKNELNMSNTKLSNVLEMIQRGERPKENPYGKWDPRRHEWDEYHVW